MFLRHRITRLLAIAAACLATSLASAVTIEEVTILHVGDQETWLLSAQGNLRNDNTQPLSYYGGVDRIAQLMDIREAANAGAGRVVLRVNAGDAILPGPRFNASLLNLATAHPDGGQDYYDAIAMRQMGFDVTVFGNHEFDFGLSTAARFAEVAGTTYLSMNLDFSRDPAFAALETSGKISPYAVYTTPGGIKIAFIGVTTPLLPAISSPQTLSLMDGFVGFSQANTEDQNLAALAVPLQALINDLRTNQNVSVVIIVSHLQNFAKERTVLLPLLTGVDAIVSGGGHELQTNSSSTTIPVTSPVFGPALPNPPIAYPSFGVDATSKQVPVYTAHFGNRYIGEFTMRVDVVTGQVLGFVDEAVRRVSGVTTTLATTPPYGPDPDAVAGNAALQASVIAPVQAYISALNSQVFAATEVPLNGERGVAGSPRDFPVGVRNAETNLGNLVADSGRFAAETDVYIQNGGGIRASIAGPTAPATQRDINIGDSFNVLTFLNIVVADPSVSAAQLKAVLEHGFAASTTVGSAQGRFPQLSGVNVIFDTTRSAGDRVRKVVLTYDPSTSADDVVIIDYGRVLDTSIRFSVGTIDFLAAGGDGYPFLANGYQFQNLPFSRNYQEAFVDYLAFSTTQGGLGGLVSSLNYAPVDAFDRAGRIVDMIYATGGRDTIVGTSGDDLIFGGTGADNMTGGGGNDTFIYDSFRDAGDIITDFVPGSDKLDVSGLLVSMGVASSASALGTSLTFTDVGANCRVNYVIPGQSPRPLVTVNGVSAALLNNASNFVF